MAVEQQSPLAWFLKDREELTYQAKKRKVLLVEGIVQTQAWQREAFRWSEYD